jgi:DNA polymerase III sliding clamp (beta) subunit (PCNA family)
LTATDAQTLFGPAIGVAIAQDDSRMYLGGAFVHDGGSGRLVVCTTNGMTLVRRHTDVLGAEHLPRNGNAHGILVPPWACREILAICRPDGCTLTTDGRLIEARTADACFVSKLIDLPFPDYHYVIPPPHSAAAEIDTKLLGVALVRLNAASTMGKAPIVGLTWDAHTDASTVFLELAREPGVVADSIPASVSGDGRLAFDAIRLGDLLGALGLLRVRIRASNPARFEPTDGTQLLALLSTAAWPRPQIAEAAA